MGRISSGRNIKKKRAFTLLELSISAGLFFLLLGIMYPNILLFQKSHTFLSKYMEYRFQERETQRLIQQLFLHLYLSEELEESCFVVEKLESKWFQKDLEDLQRRKVERGERIFFSCIFWRQERKLVKNIFFLYFEKNSLYLGEYRNGVFFLADRILLLKDVRGFFEKIRKICQNQVLENRGKRQKRGCL